MHKVLISLVASAAMLFFVSCTGRTVTYLAPLSAQIQVVGASNIVITATDYTNGLGTYQTSVWTAVGTVVVRDLVGDVGFSLMPTGITIENKTQKYNSTWGTITTFSANTANNTNIAKAEAKTNDTITLTYSQTRTVGIPGSSYTNTSGVGALTYSFRGTYGLSAQSAGGVNAVGASDVVIMAPEVLQNVGASLTVAFALTN